MQHTTLIVPGFHGSGPTHWQSWFEAHLPDARRVIGIDWEAPVLARWAGAVRDAIDRAPGPVWVVAHSFGCLASVVAAADRPERVALVLGTEGDGLSRRAQEAADTIVTIPMAGGVDSLNVAAASDVALWELRPRTS